MAEVTAKLVQELREKTSAGMMDCKKALVENNGDIEAAADWLRQKGIVKAASKAGRVAASGLVTVVKCDNMGCVVELNAETDFVAKNDKFQKLVANVANKALELSGDFDATLNAVKDDIAATISTIGENMNLRRAAVVEVKNGVVASYVHSALKPNLGKIGVLVALESSADKEKLNELGKHIAMHIAASSPLFLNIASVDPAAVEHERGIYAEQARASGKPEAIIEKMVEGRVRKYYEEVVLEEQAYIMDPDKKVKDVISEAAKELGTEIKLSSYVRFKLGEGLQKKEEDFAAEVAAQLQK